MGESWIHLRSCWAVAFALTGGLTGSGCSAESTENSPPGQYIIGPARVVDGDTIDIAGTRIRLEGIDAPEASQTCERRDGSKWPCGRAAAKALTELVGSEVECARHGTDKYDRMLGLCSANGQDINRAMVKSGLAWAFVKYSTRYTAEEGAARANLSGIWQGKAEAPWNFRQHRWQAAESTAPEGCAIKGNVSDKGKIYHLPWSPWYSKVTINAGQGERWFCSEGEAEAAGWRRANGA